MRLSAIIFVLFCAFQTFAKTGLIFETNFQDKQIFFMHEGIKATFKIENLPNDADLLQIAVNQNPSLPQIFVLGKKNINLNPGERMAEFSIKMSELSQAYDNKSSAQILLKLYKRKMDSFEILDKTTLFVRPIICQKINKPICAITSEFKKITFQNECLMNKAQADFLYQGACLE